MTHFEIMEALKSGDYQSVFGFCKDQNPAVFYNPFFYLTEWSKRKRPFDKLFWSAFFKPSNSNLINSEFFLSCSKQFWRDQSDDSALINHFACAFPKAFIDSIRIHHLFLDDGFIEKIDQAISVMPDYIGDHLDKMEVLRSKRNSLKNLIESNSYKEKLQKTSFEKLLLHILIWWESSPHNIAQDDEKYRAINRLINIYLKEKDSEILISMESVLKTFAEFYARNSKGEENVFVYNLLDKIIDLFRFETTELATYSDELAHDFDEDGDWVVDKRYRTKVIGEGEKLYTFESWLQFDSMTITERLVETGKLNLRVKDQIDEAYKLYTHWGIFRSNLLFDYITQFDAVLKSDYLLTPVYSTIHTHAKARYADRIGNPVSISDIKMAFLSLAKSEGFPIQIVDFSKLKKMVQSSLMDCQLSEEELDHVIDSLSIDINTLKHNTEVELNLLSNPIMKSRDQYLWLLPLVGGQNVMWGAYKNLFGRINKTERQESDKRFEKAISDMFSKYKLGTEFSIELKEYGERSGDIDVIVKEGNQLLVLEVKRTELRHDSTGIADERIERFKKASLQLYKHSHVLKNNEQLRNKWHIDDTTKISYFIVSPWFEHDHELIGGFKKVSLFEIQTILDYNFGDWKSANNKLERIIEVIDQDLAWGEIFKRVRTAENMITGMNQ